MATAAMAVSSSAAAGVAWDRGARVEAATTSPRPRPVRTAAPAASVPATSPRPLRAGERRTQDRAVEYPHRCLLDCGDRQFVPLGCRPSPGVYRAILVGGKAGAGRGDRCRRPGRSVGAISRQVASPAAAIRRRGSPPSASTFAGRRRTARRAPAASSTPRSAPGESCCRSIVSPPSASFFSSGSIGELIR